MINKRSKKSQYREKDIRVWVSGLLVITVMFGILKMYLSSWDLNIYSIILFSFGAAVFIIGMIVPKILQKPFYYWMKFAHALGWLNARIILGLLYYLVFTPFGLLLRLFGKNTLSFKNEDNTYWIKRKSTTFSKEDFRKQY
ncbi:MAG: hypothetical protein JXA60_00690 [Candidatus Coatesbacteria bacterium]|nr:hypothetical protein [Candidatus Coatesbacteria bacterium]